MQETVCAGDDRLSKAQRRSPGSSSAPLDGGPRGDGPPQRSHRVWTPLTRALTATGDHWTLTIVLQLGSERMRLSRLHERLPGTSTGVFTRHVYQMVALGLLSRKRFKEMPPRVELELTEAGLELVPIAEALARWGMRHMWSTPQEHEQVDIDALLQLLPTLAGTGLIVSDGSLEMVVTHTEPPIGHRYVVEQGRLELDSEPDRESTARISGDTSAWVAALGPDHDRERLHLSGDRRLAGLVLDALASRA